MSTPMSPSISIFLQRIARSCETLEQLVAIYQSPNGMPESESLLGAIREHASYMNGQLDILNTLLPKQEPVLKGSDLLAVQRLALNSKA